jgi:quinol-cytochrome oxidoreductase complex cytochrome b subunit
VEAPATYLQFGFISISVPNLLVLTGIVILFVVALLAPFPKHRAMEAEPVTERPDPAPSSNWTRKVRYAITDRWPWSQVLPDRMPRYMTSWVYVFGVCAIASLLWIVGSGLLLVFFGPTWWHETNTGKFVNSIHYWSVQIFFVSVILHLLGQYFMASWRHGRAWTWLIGFGMFVVAIATAFTGYLSQQNLDSQWIALQGKDGINSVGLGAFFNVLNYGQMFGLHVALLPITLLSFLAVHILLVRFRGLVRPIRRSRKDVAS